MRGGASNGEGERERAIRPQTVRRTANLAGRGRCNMIYHVECGPSSLFSPYSPRGNERPNARARALFVSPRLLMKWRTSICHSWLGRDNHERERGLGRQYGLTVENVEMPNEGDVRHAIRIKQKGGRGRASRGTELTPPLTDKLTRAMRATAMTIHLFVAFE